MMTKEPIILKFVMVFISSFFFDFVKKERIFGPDHVV